MDLLTNWFNSFWNQQLYCHIKILLVKRNIGLQLLIKKSHREVINPLLWSNQRDSSSQFKTRICPSAPVICETYVREKIQQFEKQQKSEVSDSTVSWTLECLWDCRGALQPVGLNTQGVPEYPPLTSLSHLLQLYVCWAAVSCCSQGVCTDRRSNTGIIKSASRFLNRYQKFEWEQSCSPDESLCFQLNTSSFLI